MRRAARFRDCNDLIAFALYLNEAACRAASAFERSPVPPMPLMPAVNAEGIINLRGYVGESHDVHVSTPRPYIQKMHTTVTSRAAKSIDRPDWEWMRQTGAERTSSSSTQPIRTTILGSASLSIWPIRSRCSASGPVRHCEAQFPPLAGPRVASDNGYVRLRPDAPGAGIRSFATDDGTYLRATVESRSPSLFEYEFWPHRDIHVEINAKPAEFKLKSAGLPYIELPGGRSEVAILYRNRWVTAFGVMYLLYALLVAGFAAPPVYRALPGARLTA